MTRGNAFNFTLRLAQNVDHQQLSDFLKKARFIDKFDTSRMLISLVTDPKLAYHVAIDNFDLIKQNDSYILFTSSEPITPDIALEIMYAMTLRKPVILLAPPIFSKDIDLFSREMIMNRLSKILVCDVQLLDQGDLHQFLHNAAREPMNYVITKHETALIKSRLKAYFRRLG
jgi:hypothetical protein